MYPVRMIFVSKKGKNLPFMDNPLQTLDIRQFKHLVPTLDEYGIGDDFFICEISGNDVEKSRDALRLFKYPLRFDGYLCIFCLRGRFSLDINLRCFDIQPDSLLICTPGNILKIHGIDESALADSHLILVSVSRNFMSGIRIDFNSVFQESLRILDNPCVSLTQEQIEIARTYLNLARRVLQSPVRNKREVISGLLSSLTYLSAEIWSQALAEASRNAPASARVKQIFDRFINLVTEYHTTERGMAFYADKLCLTPKYLSKLVKNASGRSAPEWIDAFVILEAKNMLKYSDITIKEIVYRLHFPNQSVFYKFFKAHTGMTPSAYRNT